MAASVAGALGCAASAPYLARLTLTAPDRAAAAWWRGASAGPRRTAACASVAAALGALAGAAAGWSALLPALLALALIGTPLVVIDVEHHRLPDRLVVPAAAAGAALLTLAAAIRDTWAPLLHAAEGAAGVFAVLFLLWFAAPRSLGFGDVKLGGVLGGYLGWFGWRQVYYGLLGGFVLGAVLAVALLVVRRATLKTHLAFGPMLLAGALLELAVDLAPVSAS